MYDTLPTVKVKNPAEEGGYKIINQTDFVEGTDVLFDTPEAAPADDAADAPAKRAKKAAE